jgi:M6 family metalloprotease-like protein
MLTGLGRQKVDLSIGTFCHESGHLLCRFPDMYDYGQRDGDFEKSQGTGLRRRPADAGRAGWTG